MYFFFVSLVVYSYTNLLHFFYLQIEKDDLLTEIEILKEKLEKNQIILQKALEDKETANKEFERMLEKYDRCVLFCTSKLMFQIYNFPKIVHNNHLS